ncbi:MAG: hypothetical protein U5L72_14520 [Bacteroidales bacterium]|nr:hypothetical protein [Bacteroidales bacterium]
MLKGSISSADGSITNDDTSLSVDLVKDESLKKSSSGKRRVTPSHSISAQPFPNDYEIAGILRKQKDEVKDLNGLFTLTVREVSRFHACRKRPGAVGQGLRRRNSQLG